ncbi:MAG: hypothetical protein HY911_05350 [Desulfobacterales bacterium]|nr:hypothetical protein [Desulfobacterales bacterium]
MEGIQSTPPRGALSRKKAPSVTQRWVSRAILATLAIIAGGVFVAQSRFDPGQWQAQSHESAPPANAPTAEAPTEVPGLRPMGPPETYDAATLSDKIDGKAELYLAAGFERLECQRFALADNPASWLERFVYTMNAPAGAFAVYSQQRRPQAQPLTLAADAYQAANGLFLVQGVHYLEVIGSEASETLQARMIDLARTFIQAHPVAQSAADERALFPKEGLAADSIALTSANAFGFERLDRIFTADYAADGHRAMAFLSRRASAQEAADLAGAYADYLLTYGGQRVQAPEGAPPVTVIAILDQYEIVFQRGDLLAGVHEANDLAYGLALATKLYANPGATP